ncbi:hypothetical protein EVA_14441 [gut metagenome]|uniref:Uncharacterized protein n=1 Tax=gut metagenome TaxID=749906 RepID=J9G6M8_9ZZZZ
MALTAHHRFYSGCFASLNTHNTGHRIGRLCAAGNTQIDRSTVFHHSLCVIRTARIAAGTTICAGQASCNFINARVLFHAHEFCSHHQHHCTDEAEDGDDCDC